MKNTKNNNINTSFRNIIYGGVAVEAMNTFATGPFLIAYALLFNANHIQIGFLGSIVYVGYIMHLFAAWLLEHKYSPQKISIISSLLSRPCYLIAALLAFFPSSPYSLSLLLICFSLTYLCGGIAGGAWYTWMKLLIPSRIMGRFFAVRMKFMMVAQMICNGLGAALIYYFEKHHAENTIFSYSILLSLSFIVGMYSVYTYTKIANKTVDLQKGISFGKKIFISLKNNKVRMIVCILSLLNFTMCFVTPFFSAFMLKFLSYSTPVVIMYTCLSQVTYVISSRYWGKTADKKDYVATLSSGLIAFTLSILLFAISIYVNRTLSYVILALTYMVIGFSTFALKLAMNNIPLKYVPKKDAPVYISIINVAKSFAAVISGICAGVFLTLLEKWFSTMSSDVVYSQNLSWTFFWIAGIILSMLTLKIGKHL